MNLKILFPLWLLIIPSIAIRAQVCEPYTNANACEDGNGISTNPDNLLNPHCDTLKNNFEWRVKHPLGGAVPNEFYVVYDENGDPKGVRNPFNETDNKAEYRHLADNQNSNYHPEDGWELLKVDFGALSNFNTGWTTSPIDHPDPDPLTGGARLPYMILYNKYTGTFRFFGTLLGQMEGYETVKIELRIPKRSPDAVSADPNSNRYQDSLKATNLLSIQGKSIQPLDQQTEEATIVFFAKATNNVNQFFWFDMPVAYDPCVCTIRSQLDITFAFVKTAQIDLNGIIEGAITTLPKDDDTPYGAKVVTGVIGAGLSAVLAIKSGGAIINYEAFSNLLRVMADGQGTLLNEGQRASLRNAANYVDCGGKFAGVIKGNLPSAGGTDVKDLEAASKIFNGTTTFFSSLANGCGKNDNAITTINGTVKLSGTWTDTTIVGNTEILLAIPGSKWSDKQMQRNDYIANSKTIPAYPTYNERLGTFALLKTPRLLVKENEQRCDNVASYNPNPGTQEKSFYNRRSWSFKLVDEAIQYAFNPKMRLNPEKTSIRVRFAIHRDAEYFTGGGFGAPALSYCDPTTDIYNTLNIEYSPEAEYILSTPYVPIDYITNMPFRISWSRLASTTNPALPRPQWVDEFISYEENMFIQFSIVGESFDIGKDGTPNEFVQVLTFPVKFEEQTDDPTGGQTLGNYASGVKEYDSDQFFFYESDKYFEGPVIISAKLESAPEKIRINSLNGFQILPGAEISPDIELITGPNFPARLQPERTYAQISGTCQDPDKYKAQTFANKALLAEKAEYANRRAAAERNQSNRYFPPEIRFELMPNPTNGLTTIRWNSTEIADQSVWVTVVDISGTEVVSRQVSVIDEVVQFDLSGLPSGVYMVQLKTESGYTGIRKLVKQ
ncbi:MAG TPA: hypothetical protein DDX92_10825 [Flavobacteriales bacterium]|jgi:hypothetical protein|nr:hypothetical protein [Flavobacteriales bacterium]